MQWCPKQTVVCKFDIELATNTMAHIKVKVIIMKFSGVITNDRSGLHASIVLALDVTCFYVYVTDSTNKLWYF